jgi:hypothetical protein
MEGLPNITFKSYYGQSDVCRTNHMPNVPGRMRDGHGLTAYQQRLHQTTRSKATWRNTTSRRPHGGDHQGDGKGNPYQPGAQYQQGRKITPTWTSPREAQHPKIKALMDPLLAKDFCISVKAICQACNVPMYDLPGLPKYQDSTGRSTICWNNMLKGYSWSECPLKCVGGHVPCDKITDSFDDAVCNKLGKGVTYLLHNHRTRYKPPPAKKAKPTPATMTDLTGEGQEL